MAKGDIFEIEWEGLDEFVELLDKMDNKSEEIIIDEMTKFGMLAEEGTKALVHHDEGTLEDSINFDKATKEGSDIVVRGGTNVIYALRRHEEPGRGPGTLAKPAWRGYQPGPKYMENAIKAIEPDYDKMNARALERILEADK
ncbi:hypothetical protein GCM10011409_19060 [Lentibacillus populi]|uniref:HK97 gp10 family phage protein n=1 Tax=Lentibacillus populi TaxID=1827502 RepID=A0A9W5TX21_9BACI|nr:HK97 gp10 family phage protein [Lentibacillus populi]GGB41713.1 hypothetical protein GCM10011409_19060 [Lentibacillus populi]